MDLEKKIKNLPSVCGVYIMKDRKGKIIYIGKATSLKKRVASYFHKKAKHTKELMIPEIADIDYLVCDSEAKALLLERNLIKENKPKYNVESKDDKSFPLVGITKEDYPRIDITRKRNKNFLYFGPFPQAKDLRKALDLVRKIFPFRSCRRMPKKECLYYHIDLCPGPCIGKISLQEYSKRIKMIILILEGKKRDILNFLRKEMEKASQELNFEKAAFLRDKLYAVSSLYGVRKEFSQMLLLKESLKMKKVPARIESVDISNTSGTYSTGSVVVFENGVPLKNHYRRYKIKKKSKDDLAKIEEVIERRAKRIVSKEIKRPDLVVIDGGMNQVNIAKNKFREYKIRVNVIGLAKKNEEIWFPDKKASLKLPRDSEGLKLLQRIRDEAHRFARKYHLFLRGKSFYE